MCLWVWEEVLSDDDCCCCSAMGRTRKKGLVDLHKYRNEEDDEEIKSLLSIEDEFAEAKMVENLGFI